MVEPVSQLRDRTRSPRQGLQERVAAAIVAAAGEVLATGRSDVSMAEVAAAAGMARATVYRYFPTRQALLDRVAEVAVTDAGARLADARLESVPPQDALVRAIRAFLDVGDYFTVLARERVHVPDKHARLIEEPLRRMFARGQKGGAFRKDVPVEWLTVALIDLVEGVVSARRTMGRDDTVELVASLFLDGTRGRPSTTHRRARPAASTG